MKRSLVLVMMILTPVLASAAEGPVPAVEAATSPKIRYKSGQDVNFDELLIQGELKRPEVSIVTGNVQQGTDGLLRLRENFTDRISMDAGEELQ
jgi:hypothetical protein